MKKMHHREPNFKNLSSWWKMNGCAACKEAFPVSLRCLRIAIKTNSYIMVWRFHFFLLRLEFFDTSFGFRLFQFFSFTWKPRWTARLLTSWLVNGEDRATKSGSMTSTLSRLGGSRRWAPRGWSSTRTGFSANLPPWGSGKGCYGEKCKNCFSFDLGKKIPDKKIGQWEESQFDRLANTSRH